MSNTLPKNQDEFNTRIEAALAQIQKANEVLDGLRRQAIHPHTPVPFSEAESKLYDANLKSISSALSEVLALLQGTPAQINLEPNTLSSIAQHKRDLCNKVINRAFQLERKTGMDLLDSALNPDSRLGSVFHYQRSGFKPNTKAGKLYLLQEAKNTLERTIKGEERLSQLLALAPDELLSETAIAKHAEYKEEICDAIIREYRSLKMKRQYRLGLDLLEKACSAQSPLGQVICHQRGILPINSMTSQRGRLLPKLKECRKKLNLKSTQESYSSMIFKWFSSSSERDSRQKQAHQTELSELTARRK